MKTRGSLSLVVALALAAWAASCAPRPEPLAVFYAAAFEPAMHELKQPAENALQIAIASETGGSGNLMKKMVELGRSCDLMLLADAGYFKSRGSDRFAWRLEFASDELALAVGQRAPRPDDAEKDWAPVLLDPAVRLGRADEKISPAGARTRRVWQLREQFDSPRLETNLMAKTAMVVDDVGILAARLRGGDLDYAFLYRTTCLMQDIRFIRLAPAFRLSAPGSDPNTICYALSIPRSAEHPAKAEALIRHLIEKGWPVWEAKGFTLFRPLFFGTRQDYERFRDIADFGGPF